MDSKIRFEPGKRYRFTKQKYMEFYIQTGEPLEDIEERCNSSWVKRIDGQEVTLNEKSALLGEIMGYEDNFVGMVGAFMVPVIWCEEIQEDK